MSAFLLCSAPDDYTAVSQVLTFQPGSDRQCVEVAIVNDDELENEEQFTVTITTDEDRVTLEPDSTTVTITDDDGEGLKKRRSGLDNTSHFLLQLQRSDLRR